MTEIQVLIKTKASKYFLGEDEYCI